MLRHIVMFSFKEGAQGRTRAENAALVKARLEALVPLIPEIRSLSVHLNENPAALMSDLVLDTRFDDLAALDRYQKHPDHVAVGKLIGEIKESRAAVDYTE